MNVLYAADGRLHPAWRFLLGVLFVLSSYVVSNIIAAAVSKDIGISFSISPALTCLLLFAGFSALAVGADRVAAPAPYLGLGKCQQPLSWWFGFALGSAMVGLCVGVIALFGSYTSGSKPFSGTAVLAVLWILFWSGLAEELAFRSYPFHRLMETATAALVGIGVRAERALAMAPWVASALTGLLFGAVHLDNPHASLLGFVNTVLIGIFFGLLMARTGSLWLLWGVHVGWNVALGVVFGLPVSGLRFFSVVHTATASGANWLTGGEYGLEASVPVTGVTLMAIAALARTKGAAPYPFPASNQSSGS